MSPVGPLAGLLALILIGLGFLWVIRAEYALGWNWWYVFMGAGLILVLVSILAASAILSCLLGISGASLVWGSTELEAQSKRAQLGWYPTKARARPLPPLWRFFSRILPPHL
jgi:hypothetical protein